MTDNHSSNYVSLAESSNEVINENNKRLKGHETSEFQIQEPEVEEPASEIPGYHIYEGHKVVIETKDIYISTRLKFQFMCACLQMIILGLIDQTLGSVMEHVLADYKIDRVKVSYLFLISSLGYMPASFLNHYMIYNYGIYGTYLIGVGCIIVGTSLYGLESPYLILLLASLIDGFGSGLADCCINIFVGKLDHSNQLMGIMHSFYGIGCVISPVLSIYLISKGFLWAHFYFLITSISAVNLLVVYFTYDRETKWKYRYTSDMERKAEGDNRDETTAWETFKNKYVLFYSFTLFVYLGSELSVGIWLFNYIVNIKHMSEKNASYVTSSYWSFMTLGRFTLGFFTGKYFDKREVRAIVLYCTVVALFCGGFWAFQSINTWLQCISIFFMGFFVGPIFATSVIIAINTLPVRFSTSGVSLISGIGGSGAAAIPPIMGFISENFGGGHGKGLVYFPTLVLFTFTSAALLWICFYYTHKHIFDSGERL